MSKRKWVPNFVYVVYIKGGIPMLVFKSKKQAQAYIKGMSKISSVSLRFARSWYNP